MTQMKAVNRPPEAAPFGMLEERAPFLERPVLDRVADLVKDERTGQRPESGEKPGEGGQDPLEQRQQRHEQESEGRQGVPGEEGGLPPVPGSVIGKPVFEANGISLPPGIRFRAMRVRLWCIVCCR